MSGDLFEPNTEALFERGLFFLKEQEFKAASLYFNQILDIDPQNAKAFCSKGQKMTGGLKSIRGKQESGSQKGFRFPAFLA